MISLPDEVQLDVLKYLTFNQLFSVKQTNFYFRDLINKYEGQLTRKAFIELSIINTNPCSSDKIIVPQFEDVEFFVELFHLKEKWQEAIDRSIPLFLHNLEPKRKFVFVSAVDSDYEAYLLKFSNFQTDIYDMIFARYLLKQLFNCTFESAYFHISVFNPEMINILFDNDKTIPLQFNIQDARIWANNATFETVLKFSLNLISHDLPTIYKHSDSLTINLEKVRISDQQKNILLNILIDEGNKLPKIRFNGPKITKLYDPIINYITTSRDCSIVPEILLDFTTSLHFKLSEKAENVEVKKLRGLKYKNYQIANIYNPKVRFSFSNSEDGELTYCVRIRKMEE